MAFPVIDKNIKTDYVPQDVLSIKARQNPLAYGSASVTKDAINASTGLGTNIASFTSQNLCNPGRIGKILGAWVASTNNVNLDVYIGSVKVPVTLLANTTYYIPCPTTLLAGAGAASCWATSSNASDNTAFIVRMALDVYTVPEDIREGKIWRWIGDSTLHGVNLTYTWELYQHKFIDACRAAGKFVKSEFHGFSGTNTAVQLPNHLAGYFEDNVSDLGCIAIGLGVNDSGVNGLLSTAQYKANMKTMAIRYLNLPRWNGPVLLVGATPIGINIAGTNDYDTTGAVPQRASLFEIVNELNPTYPNRIYAIDPSKNPTTGVAVFDRNSTTYLPDKIHPVTIATQAIFDNCLSPWLATSDGQRFLAALPV